MEYGITKEELLSIHSYEEFNAKREKFKGIEIDDEIMDHLCRNVFNRLTASYDESICWDAMRTANKKE